MITQSVAQLMDSDWVVSYTATSKDKKIGYQVTFKEKPTQDMLDTMFVMAMRDLSQPVYV